jgi:hypothetical protein
MSKIKRPRIGPCRDPLHLWFLEWADVHGGIWRRYFADRQEARRALSVGRVSRRNRR